MLRQIAYKQENKSIFDLDSTDIATLVNYAENGTGKAAVASKGILEFAYGYEYCNCLPNVDSSAMRSPGLSQPEEEEVEDYGLSINVKPNPASTWVAFNYSLPVYANEAVITITDLQGKKVTSFTLAGKIGQKVWDTRAVKPGTYLYSFVAGSTTRNGKIIIK